jgi:hypothetical protein
MQRSDARLSLKYEYGWMTGNGEQKPLGRGEGNVSEHEMSYSSQKNTLRNGTSGIRLCVKQWLRGETISGRILSQQRRVEQKCLSLLAKDSLTRCYTLVYPFISGFSAVTNCIRFEPENTGLHMVYI